MKKGTVSFLIILLCARVNYAQSQSGIDSLILQGKERIQKAVDSRDVQQMLAARAFFKQLVNDPTYPWLIHYYIGYADKRIVNFYLHEKNKEKAKEFVNEGIWHLEKTIELKEDFAEGYALLGSLIGHKIGLSPLRGITLGPKSSRMLKKAFELAFKNPRISLIAGQSAYYVPKMLGGGKENALRHIQEAIEHFQTFKPENSIFPTWGFDETYAYLGLIQMDRGNFAEAKQSFKKALEVNPNYGWVKLVLIKKLEEKIAKQGTE